MTDSSLWFSFLCSLLPQLAKSCLALAVSVSLCDLLNGEAKVTN